MAVPNPQEVAIITLSGGQQLTNWESVMVQHRFAEAYHIFNFTTAESSPPAPSYLQMQPVPGMIVNITLGGILAIYGPVTIRQSAMDADKHEVQIIGKSLTWQIAKSSIASKTDYSGQTLQQIAQSVAGEVGVGVETLGTIPTDTYQAAGSAIGHPSWDFLEHLCRNYGVILGSLPNGNLLLIGPHSPASSGYDFVEGQNIERIQVIWSNETVYANLGAVGQGTGSDQSWGEDVSQLYAHASGNDQLPSNFIVPQENPGTQSAAERRVRFEAQWTNGTFLTCFVTVQGWLQGGGDLYRIGKTYTVNAPSHMVDGWSLAAKTVTFTQDEENGTQTTLELVLPQYLNGTLFQEGTPSVSGPSDTQAFPTNTPAAPAPLPPVGALGGPGDVTTVTGNPTVTIGPITEQGQ